MHPIGARPAGVPLPVLLELIFRAPLRRDARQARVCAFFQITFLDLLPLAPSHGSETFLQLRGPRSTPFPPALLLFGTHTAVWSRPKEQTGILPACLPA